MGARTTCLWKLAVVEVLRFASAADLEVYAQPFCEDALRITVAEAGWSGKDLPGALMEAHCSPGPRAKLDDSGELAQGNLQVAKIRGEGGAASLRFSRRDASEELFSLAASWLAPSSVPGYSKVEARLSAANKTERVFGLGQGGWTKGTGCAVHSQPVPLQRAGQRVHLQQQKFHVTIPFAYSTAGYGVLLNMPGYGSIEVGKKDVGGMTWQLEAAEYLDFWVTALPAGVREVAAPIYQRYADATGHAPALPQDALYFWQSRLRYKTSSAVLDVAARYAQMKLPVGVLVVDYHNQVKDGDFQPDPQCYPSLRNLTSQVGDELNASVVFSVWPEVQDGSKSQAALEAQNCLINADLGGRAIDTTLDHCRKVLWEEFIKPRYTDNGITSFWLDETDGEGTADSGRHGFDTSYGPAAVATNTWVNSWIRTFTEPVAAMGVAPLALVRGVWAGGQRHGVVLWSSDIESTFEELTAQVNLGMHASLSGIPWWSSDVGGFGCGRHTHDNESPYMQELIVRWYQFGLFCPIFRTHGCRHGHSADLATLEADVCLHGKNTCSGNEVWSYGTEVQKLLEEYVRVRAEMLPYLLELAANVSKFGVPTMRPLWWEFPSDQAAFDVEDQFMLGPDILVAPVTRQNATSRQVYFPAGASWRNFFNASHVEVGGQTVTVEAPITVIPAYLRVRPQTTAISSTPTVIV